jgi:putative hydrolase of the HAD superfamily
VAHALRDRFDAVVFDLFGTLVPEFPIADWSAHFEGLAEALGVDRDLLRQAWLDSAIERQTGRLGDIRDNLRQIAGRAGGDPNERQLEDAVSVRATFYERFFRPVPGALETVRWVGDTGYRSALISMCAPDTPALWHASEFAGLIDVEVFSCEVGLRKPDEAIYLAATERLGVRPERCVYVGDGSYGELRGAAAAGMLPVLVRDPSEAQGTMLRPEYEPWSGAAIASIGDLRQFIERTEARPR